MPLYFVAILPPEAIRDEIKLLKLEIAEKTGARHALKLPAHITLQKPFKLEANEPLLLRTLEFLIEKHTSFEVLLSGFGSFPPRVIYLDIENKEPLIKLRKSLQQKLLKNGFITEASAHFHPHLTLATRDLEKEQFNNAWLNFESREYNASFLTKNISLMKHNGKFWELISDFKFSR